MSDTTLSYFYSPIGTIEIFSTEDFLTKLSFYDFPQRENDKLNSFHKEIHHQLNSYFNRKLQKFDIPLKPQGTIFQLQVWNELIKIPFGKTKSYLDIAANCNNENSVRAVGNANSKNPIAIIIPCHRVIGSNGTLTGYAGGLERKKYLLENEGIYNQISLFAFNN